MSRMTLVVTAAAFVITATPLSAAIGPGVQDGPGGVTAPILKSQKCLTATVTVETADGRKTTRRITHCCEWGRCEYDHEFHNE